MLTEKTEDQCMIRLRFSSKLPPLGLLGHLQHEARLAGDEDRVVLVEDHDETLEEALTSLEVLEGTLSCLKTLLEALSFLFCNPSLCFPWPVAAEPALLIRA